MSQRVPLRAALIRSLGRITRVIHPRGTERILRLLHHPERRDWSVRSVVPLDHDGLRLNVDTASFIEWTVFFFGTYEPGIAELIRRYLRPGLGAIDVGANIGIHTLRMARAVGPEGIVIACEPHPEIFADLRKNLELNHVQNVQVRQAALASEPGKVALFIPMKGAANRGTGSLLAESDRALGSQPIEVTATTLDALVEEQPLERRIGLIKIDVEGFEGAVIQGGPRLLGEQHPALIFEYTEDKWVRVGFTLEGTLADLRRLGYREFQYETPRGFRPLPKQAPLFANVLATA